MTVTRTQKGRYLYFESDQSGTTAAQELAQALGDNGVSAEKVVLFDVSNTLAIAEK